MNKVLCRKVVGAAGGAVTLVLVGIVVLPAKPEKELFGTWRLDVEATKQLPVYEGEDVSHIDGWKTDRSTLFRIEPGKMHFWDREWPYRVLDGDDDALTLELEDEKYDQKHLVVFDFTDDGVVFEFLPDTHFALGRAPATGAH
jgi:hypothetical protein